MRPMKMLAAAVVAAVSLVGGCYHGYDDDHYSRRDREAYYFDVDARLAGHHDHYEPRRHHRHDHGYHRGRHHHHHDRHHHRHHGGRYHGRYDHGY